MLALRSLDARRLVAEHDAVALFDQAIDAEQRSWGPGQGECLELGELMSICQQTDRARGLRLPCATHAAHRCGALVLAGELGRLFHHGCRRATVHRQQMLLRLRRVRVLGQPCAVRSRRAFVDYTITHLLLLLGQSRWREVRARPAFVPGLFALIADQSAWCSTGVLFGRHAADGAPLLGQ